MFRIAFIIGLIVTAVSLSVAQDPNSDPPSSDRSEVKDYSEMSQRILNRYDKDSDGQLTTAEWEPMLLNPTTADADQNGRITVDEYATWLQARDESQQRRNRFTATSDEPQRNPEATEEQRKRQMEAREQQKKREAQQRERREIEQREREQTEQREREQMEQRERREIEQREREQTEQREREQMEQRERRGSGQREREEVGQRERRGSESREGPERLNQEFQELEGLLENLRRIDEELGEKFGDDHPERNAVRQEAQEVFRTLENLRHEQQRDMNERRRLEHDPRGNPFARGDGRRDEGNQDGEHQDRERQDGEHQDRDHQDRERQDRERQDRDHQGGEHQDRDHQDREHQGHDDREHGHDQSHEAPHGGPDQHPHNSGGLPIQERLEHMRMAFEHLRNAGMNDLAEEAMRRVEDMERQLHQDDGPEHQQVQHLVEESHRAIHAVNERLDQIQREVHEMREQFQRMRGDR